MFKRCVHLRWALARSWLKPPSLSLHVGELKEWSRMSQMMTHTHTHTQYTWANTVVPNESLYHLPLRKANFVEKVSKIWASTTQKTVCFHPKTNHLMLHTEIIIIYRPNYTKPINALCNKPPLSPFGLQQVVKTVTALLEMFNPLPTWSFTLHNHLILNNWVV